MNREFAIEELDPQPIVGIRTTTDLKKIADTMGPLFAEVYGYVQSQGQSPVGMPLTRYHCMDGGTVDLECALPIASPIAGTERIQYCELPAGRMATVTHIGPYENLSGTWSALMEWIKSEGLEGVGVPWEVYVTDPGAEPDQSKWRTDIFFPVRTSAEPSE